MEPCNILVPDYEPSGFLRKKDKDGCLNSESHHGKHIHKLNDGTFISWEDVTPHNDEGRPIEEDEEFVYSEITKEEALKILEEEYKGSIPNEVMEIINRE